MTILAVFDFDQTLLEHNSDVVIQKLAPGGKIPNDLHSVAKEQGWTAFVNKCLEYLHDNGVTKENIVDFIHDEPYVEGAIDMIKVLKEKHKAEIIIISDANAVYIHESLVTAGIRDAISEVFTNPAEFNESGQLIVTPFTNQSECDLSERNLCKGRVMLDYMNGKQFDFVVYAGDGGNDFCPISKLGPDDMAFVRKGYALERTIPKMEQSRGIKVNAPVHFWTTSDDIISEIEKKLSSI